jgi:3-(3-hydroxy-phenyl)propionate hydroxylase
VLFAPEAQHAGVAAELRRAAEGLAPLEVLTVAARGDADLIDRDGLVAQRYDLRPGTLVLLRPDHHVCARWRAPDAAALRQALQRALARA